MSIVIAFDPTLSRVRLTGTGLATGTAKFEKSVDDGINWTTIRGGAAVPIVSGTAKVDDYEFEPNYSTLYRVYDGTTAWASYFTPSQDEIWLKSITRPFLNRQIAVVDHTDITLEARNGIFPIIGRSNPVAVTDVRQARQFELTIKTDSLGDADAVELMLASGDPLYIQAPIDDRDIPGGYVVVGTAVRRRFGRLSTRRWFDLPVTVVAPPGPGVVGSTATWETLVAQFADWSEVVSTFGSWAAVAEYVADPSTVIVP